MDSVDFENISDSELRQKLIELGEENIGPVNPWTKKQYVKKLKALLEGSKNRSSSKYDPKNIVRTSGPGAPRTSCSPLKRKSSRVTGAVNISTDNVGPLTPPAKKRRSGRTKAAEESFHMEVEAPSASEVKIKQEVNPSEDQPEPLPFKGDENEDFGNMIAKKLRKYDGLTQNIIQNEIMSIFIKADSGYYNC